VQNSGVNSGVNSGAGVKFTVKMEGPYAELPGPVMGHPEVTKAAALCGSSSSSSDGKHAHGSSMVDGIVIAAGEQCADVFGLHKRSQSMNESATCSRGACDTEETSMHHHASYRPSLTIHIHTFKGSSSSSDGKHAHGSSMVDGIVIAAGKQCAELCGMHKRTRVHGTAAAAAAAAQLARVHTAAW
jgi:hypothetical protein